MKAVKYLECSAKTGEGVRAVFDQAVKDALKEDKKKEEWMRRRRRNNPFDFSISRYSTSLYYQQR